MSIDAEFFVVFTLLVHFYFIFRPMNKDKIKRNANLKKKKQKSSLSVKLSVKSTMTISWYLPLCCATVLHFLCSSGTGL